MLLKYVQEIACDNKEDVNLNSFLQDYSRFMDDDFDAKDWVNFAFQSQPDRNVPKDVRFHWHFVFILVRKH